MSPFSRDKLLISINNSLLHRQEPLQDAQALCTTILPLALKEQRDGLLKASELAQTVAKVLDRFDNAAGVHYRAIHKL